MIIGYATQTLATIVLAPWRSYVEINYWTRRPWQHVLLFLQSNPTTKYGSFATSISVLVSGKALEFALEFEENLDNAWFRNYATPEATHPNAPDLHLVTTTVVSLVLCSYSEYDRRILQQCLGFPLCLFYLCPEVEPDLRRSTGDAAVEGPSSRRTPRRGRTPRSVVGVGGLSPSKAQHKANKTKHIATRH